MADFPYTVTWRETPVAYRFLSTRKPDGRIWTFGCFLWRVSLLEASTGAKHSRCTVFCLVSNLTDTLIWAFG